MMDGGDTLAASAHQAGFADQSHMTRAIKTMTGFPAGLLRAFLN
jgi:AraC-like DNA-binding protein